MSLSSGDNLGPYTILSPLGAGGMGEVYRARDTRLDRDVAIKILPNAWARDTERVLRFEREAKLLASLNHPHVAQVYGFEESQERRFLVLEYVPGETLAQRLQRGALSVNETVSLAIKLADAIDAAHAQGVVHRDLKPGNIMITPEETVKVLDFGLAKALGEEPSRSTTADSPTITAHHTRPGVILGTAAYMSPEQARAKSVDKRTDIWSFGVILFECLTGAAPYAGETATDSLGAILHKEPDWTMLPRQVPPSLLRLLRRSLVKDRARRLHDMADARLELEEASMAPTLPADRPPERLRIIAALLSFFAGSMVVGILAGILYRPTQNAPATVTRFALSDIEMPVDAFQGIALSPDGSKLVYRTIDSDARERLRLRSFDSLESQSLPGTELGWMPTFSPDGDQVAFYAAGFFKAYTFSSKTVRQIAQVNWGGYSGAVWMPDNSLIIAGSTSDFGRITPGSTQMERLEVKNLQDGEFLLSPALLPGGDAILCGVSNGSRFDIAVFDLRTQTINRVAENAFTASYAPSGHILFQQGQSGALMAVPFDAERRVVTGPPIPIVNDIATRVSYQVRLYALAQNGTLAYVPRTNQLENGALIWVDRSGNMEPIFEVPRLVDTPRLSHDGRRIAFRAPAPECHIWLHDLESGVTSRVTREGDNHGLAWSKDDTRIFFARLQVPHHWGIMATAVHGTGDVDVLSPPTIPRGFVSSISPDEQWVLSSGGLQGGSEDVYLVNVREREVNPLMNSRNVERAATFSRDGRYIAFVSEESGRGEVYVQSFPQADERHQVSTDGGADPVWSRDGKELFFRSDRKMMVTEISTNPRFTAGRPAALFETSGSWLGSSGLASYDVRADGQRFVMIRGRSLDNGTSIHVVLNWLNELASKAQSARLD